MTVDAARNRLIALSSDWRRAQIAALLVRTLALALPLGTLAYVAVEDGARPWAMLLSLLFAILLAWAPPRVRWASPELVARQLDREMPELEESTTLILRQTGELARLERLQRDRVLPVLERTDTRAAIRSAVAGRPIREAIVGLLAALSIAALGALLGGTLGVQGVHTSRSPQGTETPPTPLNGIGVLIVPPDYTGLESRRQKELAVRAEEGAEVIWSLPAEVLASGSAPEGLELQLIEGDGRAERFTTRAGGLELSRTVERTSVYRLVARLDGEDLQETRFARLDVLPDQPPRLAVVLPAERLTLIPADTQGIDLEIRAQDDYGLGPVELVMTLALGAGELVEFRERRVALEDVAGETEATLSHRLDLSGIELGPAAEIYLHVEALDNREPQPNLGRSPTTIVRVEGEAAVTADLGEGLPIILPPTYFRSQRQIIIDTEALIRDSPALERSEIRRRSEALAADQRALRMRYGALLGEEFVSGQPVEAGEGEAGEDGDHDHGHESEHGQGHGHGDDQGHGDHDDLPIQEGEEALTELLESLPPGMFHSHDSAETATYFNNETRAQLKRVLAEMWDAEGRLRLIDPRGALPFENRALVLLKELQQASRVYVQKVGFDAPPIDEERRLTGDLDEILSRYETPSRPGPTEIERAARELLADLEASVAEALDAGTSDVGTPGAGVPDAELLDRASGASAPLIPVVAGLATRRPEAARALEALTDFAAGRLPDREALEGLESTLWSLLPTPAPAPETRSKASDPLSAGYRALQSEGDGS